MKEPGNLRNVLQTLLAVLPPLVALAVQLSAWSLTRHVWFLFFYPAVFLSSWIGGLRAGLVATAISAASVLWFIVPPQHSFIKPVGFYFPLVVFVTMGVLFGVVHERLRKANRRIAEMVEEAPDGVFIADLEGRCTDANRAGRRMLGYDHEELIGKTVVELISPVDVAGFRELKQQLSRGGVHVAEWTLRRKDGSFVPVEVSARVLPDGRWQCLVRDISARKRLELALAASHADLVRAQSVAHVGSWRLDVRHNALEWSDEAYRIFGVAPGTPMNYEGFLACVHPDDRAYVDREWNAGRHGQPYDIEHRLVVNGAVRWVRETADLEFDENGEPIGGIGVTLDITSRKQAEEAYRLAEAKATGIISIAADAIISIDKDQRITLFNEGAETIFGHSKAEAVGAPLEILFPERFRDIHRQHVEKFAAGEDVSRRMGQRSGLAILGLRKNGEEFSADAAISKLEIDGERILTIVLRDITEQRRIEREQTFLAKIGQVFASSLDPSETLSRVTTAAVETMADFVILDLVETTGLRRAKVAYADPAKAEVARALESLPPLEHQPSVLRVAIEARQTQVLTPTDEVLRSDYPDVGVRALFAAMQPRSVMFVPLIARDDTVGVMTFVSSAPGREYQASDVRLAEEVARRAALALENSRLYRLARDAIDARDEILGIVAHDLRNPLNAIVMQASLLRQRGGEPERRSGQPADAIERAAKRMNRLIQDLLEVTRMEAGHLAVERGRVHAVQVVSDALEAHKPLASSAPLELQVELALDLPDVWADRDRLLQVFENLIGNALKFTEPGGCITIGAAPRDGEILFWIADTGAGIAAQDVPHLFDRFWRARRAGRHGAGLGLAIVKGLVEAHGGRIWVESTLGRGTTFFFTIPTALQEEQPASQPAPGSP